MDKFYIWFIIIWVIVFGLALTKMLKRYRKKDFKVFPPKDKSEIIYEEKNISGNSQKTFGTKIGGASGCLRVVVGKEEVWTTVMFPFDIIGNGPDLEHCIIKSNIQNLEKIGKKLKIEFINSTGENSSLIIRPKSVDKLYDAITKIPTTQ